MGVGRIWTEKSNKKLKKIFYLFRDLLATVGLDSPWSIKSFRLLLATLMSFFFSAIFISIELSFYAYKTYAIDTNITYLQLEILLG